MNNGPQSALLSMRALKTMAGTVDYSDENDVKRLLSLIELTICNHFPQPSDHIKALARISPVSWLPFESPEGAIRKLIARLEAEAELMTATRPGSPAPQPPPDTNRVFLAHGHDRGMTQDVARTLERFHLEPILLQEQPSKGRTIIEKVAEHAAVQCAVVLLSADDVGYAKATPRAKKPRARQNVIFETGYFLGRHGRDAVIVLYADGVELPSNLAGIVYIRYDDGGWKPRLAQELRARGYPVSADALL